jgi:hypothetical protein
MKIVKNVGEKDKKIRLFLGGLFLLIGFLLPSFRILFFILAIVLFLTSFLGFCGVYALFGINTKKCD